MSETEKDEYISILEKENERLKEVIALLPCNAHGAQCLPYAAAWIKEAKQLLDETDMNRRVATNDRHS